jgi:hypothetical protein
VTDLHRQLTKLESLCIKNGLPQQKPGQLTRNHRLQSILSSASHGGAPALARGPLATEILMVRRMVPAQVPRLYWRVALRLARLPVLNTQAVQAALWHRGTLAPNTRLVARLPVQGQSGLPVTGRLPSVPSRPHGSQRRRGGIRESRAFAGGGSQHSTLRLQHWAAAPALTRHSALTGSLTLPEAKTLSVTQSHTHPGPGHTRTRTRTHN